jgi:two-component system, cell cycle response regulator CtrA
MRFLLIEDDSATVKLIELIFKAEGYNCDTVDLGKESIEIAKLYKYDLIILDIVLPDMDGYEVLRSLRDSGINTPVLILSGLNDPSNKVKGLGYGADDYLTKPFNRSELIARAQSVIRRSKGYSSPIVQLHKNAIINTERRVVEVNGKILPLTAKEYTILEFLAMSRGKVLSKEMFLNTLYGGMDEPEAKIVDVFICKLRKKLADAIGEEGGEMIETIWGRGYMIRNTQKENTIST